jgi:methionine aminopeptidase
MLPWVVEVKTSEEIIKMRAAGKVAREVLDIAGRAVRAGITTDEIDTLVHEETIKVCMCGGEVKHTQRMKVSRQQYHLNFHPAPNTAYDTEHF